MDDEARIEYDGEDDQEEQVWWVLGRDDFRFFWNFITAFQILPCVIETRRYGYIRDSGGRVETPHGATIGCEKSYNG